MSENEVVITRAKTLPALYKMGRYSLSLNGDGIYELTSYSGMQVETIRIKDVDDLRTIGTIINTAVGEMSNE